MHPCPCTGKREGRAGNRKMHQPRLIMFAPAPVLRMGNRLRLDVKFVEGVAQHCEAWPGPVSCVLREGCGDIPFGAEYDLDTLPFDLRILGRHEPVALGHVEGADVILADADDTNLLSLVPLARQAGAKIAYVIEYTLQTRMQILMLDRQRSPLRKLRGAAWLLHQERRRRRAMHQADALQCNGYPAAESYGRLNGNAMTYMDGRLTPEVLATPADIKARQQHLRSGAPLRLIHSGRLEPMKGAQDLLPVMRELARLGVTAELDIYGSGSEAPAIAAGLAEFDGRVRLHPPVDFRNTLTRLNRESADLFLSCHRQSDPSCTYIEAMGGGLAVVGYANAMWRRMAELSQAGLHAPLGSVAGLAGRIATLDKDRETLIEMGDKALGFASARLFQDEFRRRMQHLRELVPATG